MKSEPDPRFCTLTAAEACDALGVAPQTLYAYVSRGLLRACADPSDSRRSLYDRRDVADLVARKKRGRTRREIASSTLDWGEPVLRSTVSRIEDGRLYFRQHEAVELARRASLEEAAALLGGYPRAYLDGAGGAEIRTETGDGVDRILLMLARAATTERRGLGGEKGEAKRGAALLGSVVDVAAGVRRREGEAFHQQLARGLRLPEAESDVIRAALVLCADHELNPSTYAARIAASTGASTAAALLAGIATFTGTMHGRMPTQCRAWVERRLREKTARETEGAAPGFGHRLYPEGDPRAAALLSLCPPSPAWRRLATAITAETGSQPSIDFALASLEARLGLAVGAGSMIFAVGRTAGWIAHTLEQRKSGVQIRPRAAA